MENARFHVKGKALLSLNVYYMYYHKSLKNQETAACFKSSAAAPAAAAAAAATRISDKSKTKEQFCL